jgi:hypothetical protein
MAAQFLAWQQLNPADMQKLDTSVFNSTAPVIQNFYKNADGTQAPLTAGDLAKQFFIQNASGEHMSQLGKTKPKIAEEHSSFLTTAKGKKVIPLMKAGGFRYMKSNPGQELGWKLPENIAGDQMPEDIRKEEEKRITIRDLSSSIRQARESMRQDIRLAEQELRDAEREVKDAEREIRNAKNLAGNAGERMNLFRARQRDLERRASSAGTEPERRSLITEAEKVKRTIEQVE